MTGNELPLQGLRVLDFTLIWAGPYCVMLLSDLGAEVIRVESINKHIVNTRGFFPKPTLEMADTLGSLGGLYVDGDPGDDPWNRHALFNGLGRNRHAMTVDMERKGGREVIHELIKVSDVLVDNNSAGLLEKFGVGYDTAYALNPTLVYVSMPIFGHEGPYKDYIGFGANAEGLAGLASLRGYMDNDPTNSGMTNHMDASSGIGAAYATLMALYEREHTGKGQFLEFDQMEHMIQQIGAPLMDAAMNGRAQTGLGNRDPVRAPQGSYPCSGDDRWIAISVGSDPEWEALCDLMGRPDMASDPTYVGNHARQAFHDELDVTISGWTINYDATELMHLLQSKGIPAGIFADDRDAFEDPQLAYRGFFHLKDHIECGRHRYPGHPFKFSAMSPRFDTTAPLLGQHNDLIYGELLGKQDAEIRWLTEIGHIGTAYTEQAIRRG